MKKYLFGWTNIKFGITELIKIFSGEKSFFSKKRIESGTAFLVGQSGMVYFLLQNILTMTTSDIVLWASLEFAISGYMLSQIQKEKKLDLPTSDPAIDNIDNKPLNS